MKFMEKMKIYKTGVLFLLFITAVMFELSGQSPESVKIDLLNAPVLFKENGKSFQQVVANCRSDKDGKIVIYRDGREVVKTDLKKGMNKYLITVPAVTKLKKITFPVKIDDGAVTSYSLNVIPPKKDWGECSDVEIQERLNNV